MIPAARSPLTLAQIARADAAAELERARQTVRELGTLAGTPELRRVIAAEAAYDTATADVRRLTQAGAE